VFLAYIFRHSDRKDLIFFGHFKIISVYDRKMTEIKQTGGASASPKVVICLPENLSTDALRPSFSLCDQRD